MAQLIVTSGSGDGAIVLDNGGDWATVRGASSGSALNGGSTQNVYASELTSRSIGRIFVPFDTSALGAGAIVTAATLTFEVTVVVTDSGTVHAVQTSQASTSTLVNDDYNNLAFTSGGSVAVSSTGSKVITLNATGLTWIDVSGISMFGLIEDHDQSNTDPVTTDHRFTVNMSEAGSNEPTLTITYTPPALVDSYSYFM